MYWIFIFITLIVVSILIPIIKRKSFEEADRDGDIIFPVFISMVVFILVVIIGLSHLPTEKNRILSKQTLIENKYNNIRNYSNKFDFAYKETFDDINSWNYMVQRKQLDNKTGWSNWFIPNWVNDLKIFDLSVFNKTDSLKQTK